MAHALVDAPQPGERGVIACAGCHVIVHSHSALRDPPPAVEVRDLLHRRGAALHETSLADWET